MLKITKYVTQGFGLLTVLAISVGFAMAEMPKSQAPLPPEVTSTTSTTAAEIGTPAIVKRAPAIVKSSSRRTHKPAATSTIPQYLVDRIPGPEQATDFVPESDGMSNEGNSVPTRAEDTATDYVEDR